jgi:hypothetical protein
VLIFVATETGASEPLPSKITSDSAAIPTSGSVYRAIAYQMVIFHKNIVTYMCDYKRGLDC